MKPLVKICGVARRVDAEAAVEAGADFLGFIRVPESPRFVRVADVVAITDAVPPSVRTVAVFVNASLEAILETVEAAGIQIIQLHGEEPDGLVRALGNNRVWRVVHLKDESDVRGATRRSCSAVLADSASGGMRGGTGQVGNWDLAASLAARRRMVLAGGLHPENVAGAVRAVNPWAVDVSSGVESAPGVKEAARMRAFVQAAKG